MLVVIPVDKSDIEEAKIVSINKAKSFAFIDTESGKIKDYQFKDSFENEMFDYIIVNSKNEELEDVFELGARALLARENMYIEDIIEALMFAELDEIL
ncbi:hypothetical protein [Nitrosophilus kaiyonis]|uniref:hypothetical protein n=1 Tax=Nitrosophilus kaiyonis TaxID=2930200 RepID=UPI002490508E|nr:hypothetical protein [Nitrosophilus kaiyonis]